MKLFYIDESGTGFKSKDTPYFLLAALSIDILHWHEMDKQISQLKRKIFPYMKPEDFEVNYPRAKDSWEHSQAQLIRLSGDF